MERAPVPKVKVPKRPLLPQEATRAAQAREIRRRIEEENRIQSEHEHCECPDCLWDEWMSFPVGPPPPRPM